MVKIDFPHLTTQTPTTNSGYWSLCSLKCEARESVKCIPGIRALKLLSEGKHRLGKIVIHISNNMSIGGQQNDLIIV